jgi:hypothetical protein
MKRGNKTSEVCKNYPVFSICIMKRGFRIRDPIFEGVSKVIKKRVVSGPYLQRSF